MSFKRALELTKKYYGNYPGPTERTYDKAEDVANYFGNMNVKTAGVIAVAIGSDEKYYLGLSPYLQQKVMSNDGYLKFRPDLEAIFDGDFVFCSQTSGDIVAKAKNNPGCAEKKIVSTIYLARQTLNEISVVPHPDTEWAEGLPPAMVVVGSADGALIAPCESCRSIYHS